MKLNPSDQPSKSLLTLNQVADYFSISSRTVRRLIDNKELRCVAGGAAEARRSQGSGGLPEGQQDVRFSGLYKVIVSYDVK